MRRRRGPARRGWRSRRARRTPTRRPAGCHQAARTRPRARRVGVRRVGSCRSFRGCFCAHRGLDVGARRSGSRDRSAASVPGQAGTAPGQAGPDGAGRDAQDLRDLCVVQVHDVTQHHGDAELLGQVGQAGGAVPRARSDRTACVVGVLRRGATASGTRSAVDRRPAVGAGAAARRGRRWWRPGTTRCVNASGPVEPGQSPHDGDQCLLGGVLGVAAVPAEADGTAGGCRSWWRRSSRSSAARSPPAPCATRSASFGAGRPVIPGPGPRWASPRRSPPGAGRRRRGRPGR